MMRRTKPSAVRVGGGGCSYRVTVLTAAGGKRHDHCRSSQRRVQHLF